MNTPKLFREYLGIMPPLAFQHDDLTFYVFLDVDHERYPHGVELNAFRPGTVDTLLNARIESGELVLYIRGEAAVATREGMRNSEAQHRRELKARGVIGEAAVNSGFDSRQGVRFFRVFDVDPAKFPTGVSMAACPIGEIEALPVVTCQAGDMLLKLGAAVAEQLRPGFRETYRKAMEILEAERAARAERTGHSAVRR